MCYYNQPFLSLSWQIVLWNPIIQLSAHERDIVNQSAKYVFRIIVCFYVTFFNVFFIATDWRLHARRPPFYGEIDMILYCQLFPFSLVPTWYLHKNAAIVSYGATGTGAF